MAGGKGRKTDYSTKAAAAAEASLLFILGSEEEGGREGEEKESASVCLSLLLPSLFQAPFILFLTEAFFPLLLVPTPLFKKCNRLLAASSKD